MANELGLIGLGVMGSNLALNIADHGYKIALYNYTPDLVEKFNRENPHVNAQTFTDLQQFVSSLESPRKIMMMVTAGPVVDAVLQSLDGLLQPGDMVYDLGNSNFEDTIRRCRDMEAKGVHYAGVGVSGGAEGARKGPAIMAGGSKEAYDAMAEVFTAIAAKAVDGKPCCNYVGPNGAGHYVKMVHNGIEYADMQLIAEGYLLLKRLGNLTNKEISEIFHIYNQGKLRSYLIGITADILAERNDHGDYLVDLIEDVAGQKGTGKWACHSALDLGVNLGMINAAINARFTSALLERRTERANSQPAPTAYKLDKNTLIDLVEQVLYLGKIASYSQGFALYQAASKKYGWNLDLAQIAEIFRAGCIIQADFLREIKRAYENDLQLHDLIDAPYFAAQIHSSLQKTCEISGWALMAAVPIPTISQAVNYLNAMRTACVGANLIQAMRDYFGAHQVKFIGSTITVHHKWSHYYD